jgi:single-stranded DNA-binding protein
VVVGRLQPRSWTAEEGSARQVVEVVADELGPSLRWATEATTRATRSQSQERRRRCHCAVIGRWCRPAAACWTGSPDWWLGS